MNESEACSECEIKQVVRIMTTIFIKDLIGQDILNRISAQDILEAVNNSEDPIVVLNFEGVQFTTRSFMDEFYNTVVARTPSEKTVRIEAMSKDLAAMLNVVSKTQNNPVIKITPKPYMEAKSISDMERLFASMSM